LLVASETGNVYTFATPKLQPLITKPEGKTLIQQCLNPPEVSEVPTPNQTPVHSSSSQQRLLSAQEPNLNPNSGMQDKKMAQQSQYGMRGDFQSRTQLEVHSIFSELCIIILKNRIDILVRTLSKEWEVV
jgi:hypothetical protein